MNPAVPPTAPKRNGMRAKPLQRSQWGAKRLATYQAEKAFQEQVEDLARYLGWWSFHLRNTKESPAGWPDLALFRERVIFAELKTRSPKTGKAGGLSDHQTEMAHRCFRAGAEYYAWWFPDDWEALCEVLSRGGTVTIDASTWLEGRR